ncbi:MAG TPA: HAMP domain-containing sensor histidine kinase [Ideonella sp.]|uniref:ATP-binding protein n=1 Tax=Ideonella sp. TaxID=1929293 RepID=UPI002E3508E3|nr:HAMP domain-containing sensor histidine kinase [Ideonella sp.]HEX5686962.1 HAMP domain-containing sensor histidine kinase [Ideonella sp.]
MSVEAPQTYTVSYDWQDQPVGSVLPAFDAAVAEAQQQGNALALAQALTAQGAARGALGRTDAEEALQRAEAEARRSGDATLIFQCMLAQARHDADCSRHARALAVCRQLAEQARVQGRSAMVRQALFATGTSLCHLGEHDRALESFEEARMLLRAHPSSLAEGDHRVAMGRYAAAQAQAWLMRGGLLLEASGGDAAAEALQRARQLGEQACALLLGTPPRFSHVAMFGLVRALLEAGRGDEARGWVERVESHDPSPAAAGTLALAHKRLSQAMIELRMPHGDARRVLGWLREVEAIRHPRVAGGDLRLSLLRCLFEAHEQAGQFAQALDHQRLWAQTKARLRTQLAREHGRWTDETLASMRAEAVHFVTNELRQPLVQAVQLLRPLAADDEVDEARVGIRRAEHSVRRAIDIADQYLGVMRAEHLRQEDLQAIDLATVVDDTCEQMAPPANSCVSLTRDVQRPIVARGDRLLLMRALGNLLSNAFKHAPPGSAVRVQLARRPSGVWLTVADAGPGLPLDMRVRLFQRFASGAVRNGNGLGLAMVARAARVHQARILVDSEPGQGTAVSLVLGAPDLEP